MNSKRAGPSGVGRAGDSRGRGGRDRRSGPCLRSSMASKIKNKMLEGSRTKKNTGLVTEEQKNTILDLREKKQVAFFIMSNAPKKKTRKRIPSPLRIPCPLAPGTPAIPPPKQPRPWEAQLSNSGTSRIMYPDVIAVIASPIVAVKEELLEVHDPDMISPRIVSEKEEPNDDFLMESDLNGPEDSCNPGSDVEEDPAEIDLVSLRERSAAEYPTAQLSEEIAPAILQCLEAIDAEDNAALRNVVTQDMLDFEWSSDPDTFKGVKEVFTGNAGPTFSVAGLSPLQIFEKIWDTNIMTTIVQETNRYAHQLLEGSNLTPSSRLRRWQDVSERDIWTFFAVIMLQSFVPNPVELEYWNPKYSYLKIGQFQDIMSFRKFLLTKKCLHFVDNLAIPSAGDKKLAKIQPLLDHLNEKFSSLYLPEQNVAIDESLLLWKGKLSFTQLIANKHAKVGIKSYELCESRTGYLWKMQMYSGKAADQQELPENDNIPQNEPQNATSQIVFNLMRSLFHKGHVLTMDSFYNLPLLSRALKSLYQTDTVGTLRLNREFVPEMLKSKSKTNMQPGEVCFSQTSDLSVVVWRDSNLLSLISTYHKVEVAGKEKNGLYKYKPKVVLDYNLSMGGVDKKDQLLSSYPVQRVRNAVWYKKLFRQLLNVSIHNAYVLFTHTGKVPIRKFRMRLADEILKKYSPLQTGAIPKTLTSQGLGHFPKKNSGKQRCKLCAKAKVSRRTTWMCEACNVNLCILGCFKDYHTQLSTLNS